LEDVNMSGRNGKRANFAKMILVGVVAIGMSSAAIAQMMLGAATSSGDPVLDMMLQQQRMLAEEISNLESHMERYPISEPGSELVRDALSADLDRLKTDIVEVDDAIDDRRSLLAEEEAVESLSAPADPRFPSGFTFPEHPREIDPRNERDQMLYMLQRERLEEERRQLVDRLARLRPDEAALASVLQRQLTMIETDLETLEAEFESNQPDVETASPLDIGSPPWYPGTIPPVVEMPAPTLPQLGLTGQENDIMIRRRLLFEAADNLRLAGFQDLANQAIEAADGLLNTETPPLGEPEYGGPGLEPTPPEYPTMGEFPGAIPENTFGLPGERPPFMEGPGEIPPYMPGQALPEATVEPPFTPPYVAPLPPEAGTPPVETPAEVPDAPAAPSENDDLRAELELLRAQLEAINSRLDQ
jgi:hypothetical protein